MNQSTTLYTFTLQALQYKAFFRMGVARPLSPLFSETDRYLTARYTGHSKDRSLGTLLGIGIELAQVVLHKPRSFPRSRLSCRPAPATLIAGVD
jgi:hypothetical protein